MKPVTITTLHLKMSNAYLVQGEGAILVDSGVASDEPKMTRFQLVLVKKIRCW